MGLFQWWKRSPRERVRDRAEAMIRRTLASLSLPSLEIEPQLWSVVGDVRHKYRMAEYLWPDGPMIHCVASCEIIVERDWLPRELMLVVLEENHWIEDCSFRLTPKQGDRILALGRVIDSRYFPEAELGPLVTSMLHRMQVMVTKLYGMGLIIEGPDREERPQPPQRHSQ